MSADTGTESLDLSAGWSVPQHPEGNQALVELLGAWQKEPGLGREMMDEARRQVAELVGAAAEEVIFTSGGSEANNTALKGLAGAAAARNEAGPVVISAVEHSSVLHAALGLEGRGFSLVQIPVDGHGAVDVAAFDRTLAAGAAVAALQWANDELGTIQPLAAVAGPAADRGIPLHVDATAAAGWVPLEAGAAAAATMSLSSRKLGGPPGVGALVIRSGQACLPLIAGGLEEDGRRAGLLHPALVAAFGLSAAAAVRHGKSRAAIAGRRRQELAAACRQQVEGVRLHEPPAHLAGHLHLSVPGVDGEALLLDLRRAGIVAESGSDCVEGAGLPSRILRAAGMEAAEVTGSVLFRLTASHKEQAVARVAGALAAAVRRLRDLAP